MGRVLLLGSGYSAVPLYSLLAERHEVFVLGGRESDPLSSAENFLRIDYREEDEVLESARNLRIDYLIPSCNDVAYQTGTKIATLLGLPGFDGLDVCNSIMNKLMFRKKFQEEFFTPKFMEITEAQFSFQGISDFVLLKPRRGHSGIGIEKIEINNSVNHERVNSLIKTHFLEEYLEGSLHSHSAFFSNGLVVADFVVDEYCGQFPFAVSESNYPSNLSGEVRDKIRNVTSVVASALGIKTGLLHSQFIFDGKNVWILESMRRCPGDFFGTLIEKSTGYNYYKNYIANFTEEDVESFDDYSLSHLVVRQSIFPTSTGKLFSIISQMGNIDIEEVSFLPFTILDKKVTPTLSEKVGIVFFTIPIKHLSKNVGFAVKSFGEVGRSR